MSFYRIMGLDDEKHVLNLWATYSSELEIIGSISVRDFLDSIKKNQEENLSISAFILDYNLGRWENGVTGADVARRLRLDFPDKPIFLVSSQKGPAIKEALKEHNLIFISKSQDVDTIEDTLSSNLRAHNAQKVTPKSEVSVEFDIEKKRVKSNGINLELRTREFDLLKALYDENERLSESDIQGKAASLREVGSFRTLSTQINKKLLHLGLEILRDTDRKYYLAVDRGDSQGFVVHTKKRNTEVSQYSRAIQYGIRFNQEGTKIIGPKGRIEISPDEFFILKFLLDQLGQYAPKDLVFMGAKAPQDNEYRDRLKMIQAKLAKISSHKIKGATIDAVPHYGIFHDSQKTP